MNNPDYSADALFIPGLDPASQSAPLAHFENVERGRGLMKKGILHVHEAFADYMLINPGCTLRDMAAHFSYTPPWICTIINTDMFKAYLRKRRDGIEIAVAQDIPTKLVAAGHLVTEKLLEKIEKSEDPEFVLDAFDKVMHRMGYAPNSKASPQGQANVQQQNNVFFLEKGEMANLKANFLNSHNTPSQLVELNTVELPAEEVPAELPFSNGS